MTPQHANLRSLVSPDGALILDLEHDRMVRLNETGGKIWLELQCGKRVEEIAEAIAAETGEDFGRVLREVRDFCVLLDSLLDGSH